MANTGEQAFKTQINRIKQNVADAYTRCSQKGATMPTVQNSNNLPSTIASILAGGGGGNFEKMYVTQTISGESCTLSISTDGSEENAKVVGQIIAGDNGKIYIVEV